MHERIVVPLFHFSKLSVILFTERIMLWIFKHKKKRVRRPAKSYLAHRESARAIITQRVQHYADGFGFSYGRIAIKNQKRCWGSCSTKKNLNFNYKLAFLPIEILDYVVVHELCHLRHFHHGPSFWIEVERILPNYKERMMNLRYIERTSGAAFTRF